MARHIAPFSDEFQELFHSWKWTAFRLETRQDYAVDYETGPLRAFLAGDPRPYEPDDEYWDAVVRGAVDEGKSMSRVHVVLEPLSDYMRFELTWGYDVGAAAGEDIRILPVPRGQWPGDLPAIGYDYWMFDSSDVYRMDYDQNGSLYDVVQLTDPSEIVQHNVWRDIAMQLGTPLSSYLQRFPTLDVMRDAS